MHCVSPNGVFCDSHSKLHKDIFSYLPSAVPRCPDTLGFICTGLHPTIWFVVCKAARVHATNVLTQAVTD